AWHSPCRDSSGSCPDFATERRLQSSAQVTPSQTGLASISDRPLLLLAALRLDVEHLLDHRDDGLRRVQDLVDDLLKLRTRLRLEIELPRCRLCDDLRVLHALVERLAQRFGAIRRDAGAANNRASNI